MSDGRWTLSVISVHWLAKSSTFLVFRYSYINLVMSCLSVFMTSDGLKYY